MEEQRDSTTSWEASKRSAVNEPYHHDRPKTLVSATPSQFTTLNAEFKTIYQSLLPLPTVEKPRPTFAAANLSSNCPSGLTEREKMHQMDEYLPLSSSHYGGSLPLSPYLQNTCVMVRSSNIWRNQKYALPSRLGSFKKVNQLLNEQNDCSMDDCAPK